MFSCDTIPFKRVKNHLVLKLKDICFRNFIWTKQQQYNKIDWVNTCLRSKFTVICRQLKEVKVKYNNFFYGKASHLQSSVFHDHSEWLCAQRRTLIPNDTAIQCVQCTYAYMHKYLWSLFRYFRFAGNPISFLYINYYRE